MEANQDQPKEKLITMLAKTGNGLYNFFASFNKFRRSAFLSIIILAIIFLLVKALDQAYTLLVDMLESDPVSLILCFGIISVFGLVISHYPIYIYYAKDINDSKNENYWYIHKWLGFYNIFTFAKKPSSSKNKKKDYKQDYLAKFFRYSLGLFIFCIWTYYIFKTYEPKLYFAYDGNLNFIWAVNLFYYITPFLVLIYMLPKKQRVEDQNKIHRETAATDSPTYKRFYTNGILFFYGITLLAIIVLLITAFGANFNTISYFLLQSVTLFFALSYIYFRLFRSKLYDYGSVWFVKKIEVNFNYVVFFFITAILILGLLIYSNIAVAYGLPHVNAMVILLGYIYIIYYGLACILKYLFVVQAIKRQSQENIDEDEYLRYSGLEDSRISRIIPLAAQENFVKRGEKKTTYTIVFMILVIGLSMVFRESPVHELNTCLKQTDDEVLKIDVYVDSLKSKIKNDKPLIFVASHGGALKANIWTMKLLNHIQKETNGEFLNQTASFSGASGGMMGLSMYAVLAGKYPNTSEDRFTNIENSINIVARENYASMDISYTLGWDFIRKAILLRELSQHRDRAFYSMVMYQNLLENKEGRNLTAASFQSYWKENIYDTNGYFPALLVNTAKTNGRRGVFSSVRYDKESVLGDLFLNADNLAQLEPISDGDNGEKTKAVISFYQAVSCTNRFPGFSPAAKIKGYGHYIDAGAIDNSGLLTSLDWYDNLKRGKNPIIRPETNVIFVEIINGKSNYVKYLLETFKKEEKIDFMVFNEKEQGNLSAVISAGANLDKNPDYFSDLIKRLEERGRATKNELKDTITPVVDKPKRYRVQHLPIYLPRVITMKDVETFVGGEIEVCTKQKLDHFLDKKNKEIFSITEDSNNKHTWKTYEPTLARHLSKSTLRYYDSVLKNSAYIKKDVVKLKKELKIKS